MSIPHRDELLLQRHVDGELAPDADAAFRARAAAEPELARALAEARALRAALGAARGPQRRPSAAFTAGLLTAIRQLPTRQQLEQADVAAQGIGWCRRLLLAAAILAGIGLVWQSGLIQDPQPDTMQAAPGDVQREIERLQAELASGRVAPPGADARAGR